MSFLHLIRNVAAVGTMALVAGCVGAPDDSTSANSAEVIEEGPVDSAASAITGGSPANSFMRARTVAISTGGCTGVIIGPRHVLTAAHCGSITFNTTVKFYSSFNVTDPGSILVTNVAFPLGVSPSLDDWTDTNGNFADLAVLTLQSNIPSTSVPMELGINYPGNDAAAIQVGQGNHNGVENTTDELRFASNNFYSSDTSGGYFYTNDSNVDGGDSGGPVFSSGLLQGVLWGHWVVAGAMRAKYTSVGFHLPFILASMGYTGNFSSISTGTARSGTVVKSTFTPDLRTCKLDCMQTSTCVAFTHRPALLGTCQLHSTLGSAVAVEATAVSGVRAP